MLSDNITNRNRLLYELALSCAQVAQVEQFELVVPASANEVNGHYGVGVLGASTTKLSN